MCGSMPPVTGSEQSERPDRFALNVIAQIGGRLGAALLGLLLLRVLTQALGRGGFGQFSAAMALVLLLNALTSAGLATSAARDAAIDPARAGAVHAAALTLRSLGAVASIPVAVGAAALLYRDGPALPEVALLGLAVGAGGVAAVSSLGLVMGGAGWISGVLDVVRQALLLASVVVLVVVEDRGPGPAYALGLVLGMALTVALALKATPWRNPKGELQSLLRAAAPLGLVEALNTIYFRIDSVILAVVAGNLAVGDYSLAYRIVELAMTVPGIVMTSLAPRLSRSQSPAQVVQQGLHLLQQLAVPLLVLGWVAAPLLVDVVSSEDFTGAVLPLRLLLLATAVSFLVAPYGNGLVLLGLQGRLVRVAVVVTGVNVLANLLVVSRFGASGAAACVVATECLGFVMARRRFDEVERLRSPLRSPAMLGGALMVLVWLAGTPFGGGDGKTLAILLVMSATYGMTIAEASRRGWVGR